ncbi:hypothetical protein D9M71_823680 [compost metagenome]
MVGIDVSAPLNVPTLQARFEIVMAESVGLAKTIFSDLSPDPSFAMAGISE